MWRVALTLDLLAFLSDLCVAYWSGSTRHLSGGRWARWSSRISPWGPCSRRSTRSSLPSHGRSGANCAARERVLASSAATPPRPCRAWVPECMAHSFHRVRLCDGGDCIAPQSAAAYPRVPMIDRTWRLPRSSGTRRQAPLSSSPPRTMDEDDRVPMVIVATAGGGIRAAIGRRWSLKNQGGPRPEWLSPLSLRDQWGFGWQRRRDGVRRGSCQQRRDLVRRNLRAGDRVPNRGLPCADPRERDFQGHTRKLPSRSRAG